MSSHKYYDIVRHCTKKDGSRGGIIDARALFNEAMTAVEAGYLNYLGACRFEATEAGKALLKEANG